MVHGSAYCALAPLHVQSDLRFASRIAASEPAEKVQRLLGVPRASLGSLSEANRVFDAELLKGLIGELASQLQPLPHDPRLSDVGAVLTLVDGTLLDALPKMAWALWKDDRQDRK